jgi:hypothetical protein
LQERYPLGSFVANEGEIGLHVFEATGLAANPMNILLHELQDWRWAFQMIVSAQDDDDEYMNADPLRTRGFDSASQARVEREDQIDL